MVVVGLPEGRLKGQTKEFGQKLKESLSVKVVFWDETLTSLKAQELLQQSGLANKKRRQNIHQTAAALLLQSYLDAKRNP
jgi:putative Holliday junction resolvase